jgi:hypothetical protein
MLCASINFGSPVADAAGAPKIINTTPSVAAIAPAASRVNRPVLVVMRTPPC